jgi:general secretion pathway protein D
VFNSALAAAPKLSAISESRQQVYSQHGNQLNHTEDNSGYGVNQQSSMPDSAPNNSNSQPKNISAGSVVLNFENADIQSTIRAISQLSGKNFVIDPRVKGTVTIVSDQPISKSDSYKVLETALRMQGFAVVEGDGVIKVLPEADAKTYGMKTLGNGVGFSGKKQIGDQVITKIFIIRHGSATQLANSLRPLIAPNNSISVYAGSNALIVTDYASNISRISKIVEQLSSASTPSGQPEVVSLKYAVAADVAQVLQSYMQTTGSGGSGGSASFAGGDGPPATVTVDAVNNQLIISSSIKERVDELKNLAVKLDNNSQLSNNNLHVVYLRNADARHIADVLRVIATGQDNPDLAATSASSRFASEPGSMFQSQGGSGGGGGSFGGGATGGGSSRPSSPQASGSRAGATGSAQTKDQPKIVIQAEPTTNSLIIQAPDAVYRNFRMIISMLDVRRAQIMIEAMIVDINSDTSGAFGIQWAVAAGNNQLGAIGIGNYARNGAGLSNVGLSAVQLSQLANGGGTGGATATPPQIPNEALIGLVTGTVTVGGQTIPTLGALADMISANSSTNILSRPTLITLDNEEAKIMVGQNVPVQSGSFQNTAGQSAVFNTVARQDIGTFLDIKPLITQSGAIQLEIYQEDSKIDNATTNSADGPTFLKRNLRATLLVDDGQIIAIGGMTHDDIAIVKSGVPLLSDIPYLGWLFSWQSREHLKQNLVLFLRPVIIRNADGYKALSNTRYQYVIDQQNTVQAKGNLMLPRIDPVNLDNQVPYANQTVSGQTHTIVPTPVLDVRASKLNGTGAINTAPVVKPAATKMDDSARDNDTLILPAN